MKNENVVKKNKSHSRVSVSGIFNACRCNNKDNTFLGNNPLTWAAPILSPAGEGPFPMRGKVGNARMRGGSCGFSLIELLVVVLIIGILAAVALPQYQLAVAKSRVAGIQAILASIKQAEEAYYLENGTYTSDIAKLDLMHNCQVVYGDVFHCDPYFAIDPIGGETNFYIKALYCPADLSDWSSCNSNKDFQYTVWLNHSAHPNQIGCSWASALGQKICNSLNF